MACLEQQYPARSFSAQPSILPSGVAVCVEASRAQWRLRRQGMNGHPTAASTCNWQLINVSACMNVRSHSRRGILP